jgi:signal transduction histidine kinase
MEAIVHKVEYLSENINTFRDFLREKKEVKEVILEERIDVALKVVNLALKDNFIKLVNNIDYSKKTHLVMSGGELVEVIINVINNAKDALIEKSIKSPWVELNLFVKDEYIQITIEDNAGGIPDDVLPKVFDEYFSTKDETIGTGLGLYMSYKIITDSLKGKIYVKNTDNGAKFFIEIPFCLEKSSLETKEISYPVDSLSLIEQEYCNQLKKESSCKSNEKFSVKNFMLKNSD